MKPALTALTTIVLAALLISPSPATAQTATLKDAQLLFYNARYEAAALAARDLCSAEAADLTACELSTSARLFQIKRAIGDPEDKEKALKACAACPELMTAFQTELAKSMTMARARILANPADDEALFLFGKLNLNFVWLHLGTLGRKTGWTEYWDARKSLDTLLERQPNHVRARVARAWIDYIVGTKAPRGTRWLLGGGNKKKGLATVADAATKDAAPFVQAEAGFALWDMQVREKAFADAVVTARALAVSFPDNEELRRFLDTRAGNAAR